MGFHILSTSEVVLAWWPVMPPASSNQLACVAPRTYAAAVVRHLKALVAGVSSGVFGAVAWMLCYGK